MPLEKNKTGLILLGASEFPEAPCYAGSEAFANAKQRIRSYFESSFFETDSPFILDLFDEDFDPNEIDTRITNFLRQKKAELKDLIVYYVGHGGYDNNNGFVLAIKQSREENLGVSSITAQSLGKTLSKEGRLLRLFLVLDCCFAADFKTFQSSSAIDVVQKDISNHFPQNGLALLCSSSKDKPAVIIQDKKITMFSESLHKALQDGNPEIKREYLTLREIGELTFSHIKSLYPGNEVRPEVHSPKMPNGDIADIPHFPNKGFDTLTVAYDIVSRKAEFDNCITQNNVVNAGKLFLGFVNDFDRSKKYKIEALLITAECNSLEEEKPPKYSPEYKQYSEARVAIYRKMLEIVFDIIN